MNLVKLNLGSQAQIEIPSKFKTEHFPKQATGTNLKHSSGSLRIRRLNLVFGTKILGLRILMENINNKKQATNTIKFEILDERSVSCLHYGTPNK